MKLIIFTFLAVCLLSFSAFGQTEAAKKNAFKVAETDASPSIKHIIQNIRDTELAADPTSKLYIINYGTPKLVAMRVKNLNRAFDFMPVDKSRVEFAPQIPNPFLMTEFWIVPEGAENPKPTTYSKKVEEVWAATDGDVRRTLEIFAEKLSETKTSGYLVNYGTKQQKLKRIKQINKAFGYITIKELRILIVDGGYSKHLRTEFWIVPPKSEK